MTNFQEFIPIQGIISLKLFFIIFSSTISIRDNGHTFLHAGRTFLGVERSYCATVFIAWLALVPLLSIRRT